MNQETALSILKNGHNVYLTGSAGTGKTYLINQYVKYLKVREVPVAVTASTGIAATHIGGQTIHSWSGIGIKEMVGKEDFDRIRKNKQTVSRLVETKVLIIDEISMLSGKVLTGINDILKHFRKSEKAFGGVQIILSGDFFQLPPVSRYQVSNREKFAFMAPIWVQSEFKICYLTVQFRQTETFLTKFLSEIRAQDIAEESVKMVQDKLKENPEENGVKLFTHNADVDAMNASKLAASLNSKEVFVAVTKGKGKIVEGLMQSVLASPSLELKVGAKVMFVRNNPERGYFNGTMGEIMEFDGEEGYPLVKTQQGRWVLAKPEEWTITDEKDNILASYKQVPLRLAWAITVHKSQGMTLEKAEIDLSKTFEPGQGYVALSRLRDWEGLQLRGINSMALSVDGLAYKADQRFQELSKEHEVWIGRYEKEALAIHNIDFIKRSGGTNDPEVIHKNETREEKKFIGGKKENTYEVTKKLIEAGKSLEEIAFEREFTQGTIISHIQKIRQDHPDVDIDQYKPDQKKLDKLKSVISKLKLQNDESLLDSTGQVKLGFVHRALNGKMDYEEIRLARLFI